MGKRDFNSKKKRGGNLDKISNLPQEVTDKILMCIPIKDAVKTSVLSTKWRFRWTSIPELVFDKLSMVEEKQNDENLVKVVNNVLLLHNAAISQFVLNDFLVNGFPDVDRWIIVLSRSKMLYHLVLAFNNWNWNDSYKLPSCLFSCETLRTLKLQVCKLRLPSQYKGFSHLTKLKLFWVDLPSETFNTLVAKIPLLKKLKVSYCCHLTNIHVHAPNLEVVRLKGSYESVNFHNTPNLIKIHLSLPKVTCWVDQVHEGRNELQAVQVNDPNMESFPIADIPEGLYTTYRHLKCPYLLLNLQDYSSQILAVLFLCKISPCLEELDLTTYGKRESADLYEEHFWDERLQAENVLHHLKTVRFQELMGVQHELGFIQFILLNALVLETFDIFWRSGTLADNEKLHIVQKMMEFQRASRNAKFTCHSY